MLICEYDIVMFIITYLVNYNYLFMFNNNL